MVKSIPCTECNPTHHNNFACGSCGQIFGALPLTLYKNIKGGSVQVVYRFCPMCGKRLGSFTKAVERMNYPRKQSTGIIETLGTHDD